MPWADGSALTDSFTSATVGATYTAVYNAVQGTLPSPWQSTDVGAPLLPGTADYSASTGTVYIDGTGADILGKSDQFHYVWQTLNGDGTIIARVCYHRLRIAEQVAEAPARQQRVHVVVRMISPV